MMLKTILKIVFFLSLFMSQGCNDKQQESSTNIEKDIVKTPQIEIVSNKDSHQIKVKETQAPKGQNKSYYLDYDIKSEYNQNSQPANKDASVRVKARTTTDAQMHVRSPYEKLKISMMVKKLSKKFIVKCSACHNDYANGIIGPSLLHKSSDEIMQKIADFKTGKKSNPLMSDLINMMSDQEISDLAKEIYGFNKEIKKLGI